MTTFVLVHGAWHGAWCWRKVGPRLRAAGHEVFAPTLTGLADRSHLLSREISLATHIEDVAGLIRWEDLHDIVLVGHSYGGQVIGGVADRMPGRIATLVFLDAMIPQDGVSAFDRLPAARQGAVREAIATHGEGWKAPPPPAAFWNLEDPADAARVERFCTPQPARTLLEPARVTGAWERVADKVFILAEKYVGSAFHAFHAQVNGRPGWRTFAVDCGHEVMLDRPEALVRILAASATR